MTLILSIIFSVSGPALSQDGADVSKWKTIVLNSSSQVKIPAPPGIAQSKSELKELKVKSRQLDNNMLHAVQYWDAGAPAYRWNEIAYKLAGPEISTKKNGGNFWRMPMAWMNIAIYDATIAAWKIKYTYNRKRPFQIDPSIIPILSSSTSPSYPCEHAVTAAAAATVLGYFFPEKADSLLKMAKIAAGSRLYTGVQFPSDINEGWKLGEEVAKIIIEQAKKDGSDMEWKGKMSTDPKGWQGPYPVGAVATNIKPIFLTSCDQFRPPPPPDFNLEMMEMKNFKQNFYSTYLAYRWAFLSGLDFWTELTNQKIFEYRLDKNTPQCARIYALMHATMHDATTAIMDAKYAYFGIRPNQYDTSFRPLIGFTPPFPGYPSGHATASSAAATMLSYFFPAEAAFFKQQARECAESRFYAGIHFKTDNEVGIDLGEKL
ncbi:MAG TPA: phosphatase PAP2 family protein, partial [Chitinophagaceae bacterium]|nr:phosphatase PAP2 family protein [Chitinophagaceae bacterium]